jgi:hypothetical protein
MIQPQLRPIAATESRTGKTAQVAKVFWGLCIAWIGLCVLTYFSATTEKEINAIQQAGLAASTCVWMIAAYIVCRAIDSLSRE